MCLLGEANVSFMGAWQVEVEGAGPALLLVMMWAWQVGVESRAGVGWRRVLRCLQ